MKPRTIQRSPLTTSREMDPLSEVTNANGRDPLASASTWPITPPWEDRHPLADVGGRQPPDRVPHPDGELGRPLGTRDDLETLLGPHPHGGG